MWVTAQGKTDKSKHNKVCQYTHISVEHYTTLYNYYNIIIFVCVAADVVAHGPDCAQSSWPWARGDYERLYLHLYQLRGSGEVAMVVLGSSQV